MVARNADDLLALDPQELLAGLRVLVRIAVVGQVSRDDDQVWPGLVDLIDRRPQELLPVAAAADVDVGDLSDQHRASLGWDGGDGLERRFVPGAGERSHRVDEDVSAGKRVAVAEIDRAVELDHREAARPCRKEIDQP